MDNKYCELFPEVVCLGLVFEHFNRSGKLIPNGVEGKWVEAVFDIEWMFRYFNDLMYSDGESRKDYRVKYLDENDILELGAIKYELDRLILKSKGRIFEVKPYYDAVKNERENLVRIFICENKEPFLNKNGSISRKH